MWVVSAARTQGFNEGDSGIVIGVVGYGYVFDVMGLSKEIVAYREASGNPR